MNDVILMSEIGRLRDTTKYLLVQSRMKDAAANVKRARTLLKNAESMLRWAKQYTPERQAEREGRTLCETFTKEV